MVFPAGWAAGPGLVWGLRLHRGSVGDALPEQVPAFSEGGLNAILVI